MPVLAFADDHGATLIAALGGQQPAEILKTAEWREPFECLDRDFALILVDDDGSEHRKYACHDAGNTLVSMFYLEQAVDQLNPAAIKTAAANLAELGRHQGLEIPENITKLAELSLLDPRDIIDERRVHFRPPRVRSAEKVASGPYERLREIQSGWDDMEPHEKRAAAVELHEFSQQVPLQVPRAIDRYAGDGLSEKFASHMKARLPYVRDPELASEYKRLAKVAGVLAPNEVVSVLYELDNRAGLRWSGGDRYGEKIADPFLCVFDRVKEAEYSWNHGGEFTNERQLDIFPYKPNAEKIFRDTFTEALWLRFKANPLGTFKSMPVEQQILVSRMVRQRE